MSQDSVDNFDKVQDAASYNHAAAAYNKYIERLAAPIAVRMVTLANLVGGQRVLDVGTGSGVAARCAARAVGPAGIVQGIDLSAGMLQVAAEVSRQQQLTNVEFQRMDAEALDLPSDSFDAVISLCAVAHFPNITKALAEMSRVLRPRHRIVVAIGCGRPPLGSGLFRYSLGRLGMMAKSAIKPQLWAPGFMTKTASRWAPDIPDGTATTWSSHNATGKLTKFVQAAGFQKIETCWAGHRVAIDSAEEFWEAQASIETTVRKRLLALPPEQLAKMRKEFLDTVQRTLDQGGSLYYPYGAFFVTGVRGL